MTKTEAVKALAAKGYSAAIDNEIPTIYLRRETCTSKDIRKTAADIKDIFTGIGYEQSYSVKIDSIAKSEVSESLEAGII